MPTSFVSIYIVVAVASTAVAIVCLFVCFCIDRCLLFVFVLLTFDACEVYWLFL